MNLTNEQIGQRIKAVRLEKNLTQTQLAQLLGKSLRTVQSYESGESRILLDTVTTIAHALGVTPTYLLGVSEPQIKLNVQVCHRNAKIYFSYQWKGQHNQTGT